MGRAAFNNSIYYVVFPIVLFLYLFVVITGYSIGLSKSFPDTDARFSVSILVAVIIGLSLWALAVYIARLHGYDASHKAAKFIIESGLVFLLICASALGVINAAFFYFEGKTVLRQAVDRSEMRVSDLQNLSNEKLPAQQYIDVRNNVMSLVQQLQSEVENGGTRIFPTPGVPQPPVVPLCGVGSRARTAIDQIHAYLPNYAILAGSEAGSLNCRDRDAVLKVSQQYRTNAEKMLPLIPLYSQLRVAQRQQLQRSIDSAAGMLKDRLSQLKQDIASLSIVPHKESPEVQRIVRELDSIESQYSSFVRQLMGVQLMSVLNLPPQPLPETLELDSARKIGSFISTMDVILDRIRTGQAGIGTVLYILAPFVLDLSLIAVIYLVLTMVRKPPPSLGRGFKKWVRYILTPMPK